MSTKIRLPLLTFVLVIGLASPAPAAAPAGGSKWYNPMTWSAPTMPWSKEPPRIKRKSQGMVGDLNRTAQSGWTKTKDMMNPSKVFVNRDDSKKSQAGNSGPGFWSSMFPPKEKPREIRTVSDFLKLPPPD